MGEPQALALALPSKRSENISSAQSTPVQKTLPRYPRTS
ncbi:hypothetical protein GLA29479_3876 [Lysobacter antibioticus]|uniref:Uncharacterized protein n=1 Tax=Lysobacter antibioticus TaxID=84531 RepID=A0A0S2E1X3_LYSAN|nr:hypothetical protein GLA29479_3876 [Lysobacter antibioticus]ALN81699.1 hypothetical protein LA76x_3577 [Lysobacter antibioticus]